MCNIKTTANIYKKKAELYNVIYEFLNPDNPLKGIEILYMKI